MCPSIRNFLICDFALRSVQSNSPGIPAVERPYDPDPKLRGLSETSNTRTSNWMSRKLYGKVQAPRDGRNDGAATLAMSTVGSYKATLATLAAVAFLGEILFLLGVVAASLSIEPTTRCFPGLGCRFHRGTWRSRYPCLVFCRLQLWCRGSRCHRHRRRR